MKYGKVFLVGAGPGDPGLITIKGIECIKKADVLIYDYLAASDLLKYTNKNVQIIYVGKKGGDHTMPQQKINELIIEKAKEGLAVTRLKGGDPFIFGRGAEEAEELFLEGIEFEIVPGVTSAIAAPAYAGIPLTHRGITSTLAFVTGHEDPNKEESSINWSSLAKGIGTLVFLMGVKNLSYIVRQLVNHGMPEETPVAMVQWGTTPQQRTVGGTLKTITDEAEKAGLQPPAVIIVGEVVKLRDKLNWYEKNPLFGKRIAVTRAREQASDLVNTLTELGASCLEFPTIEVVPVKDWDLMDRAICNISSYDFLVFTSVNGVKFFFERLLSQNKDSRNLGHLQTVCIGPATAKKLFEFGVRSDIVPDSFQAESILEAFKYKNIKNKKFLLPRAEEARPLLPEELRKMGAKVDEIAVYKTRPVTENRKELIELLEEKKIDMVTFTSSSTVKNFTSLISQDKIKSLMSGVSVACIGPVTSDTAKSLGYNVDIIAANFTIPGLCEAILEYIKT